MLSQSDTLKMLDCSKSSLSKYVKNGDLKRNKEGRNTFYDEHEVVLLAAIIKADRKQFRPDLSDREKETIVAPSSYAPPSDFRGISISTELNDIGLFYLKSIIDHLEELNLYKATYLPVLNRYGRAGQLYEEYSLKASAVNSISTNNSGSESVHPYHKVAENYKKEMNTIENNFGLNLLALQKIDTPKGPVNLSILESFTKKEEC